MRHIRRGERYSNSPQHRVPIARGQHRQPNTRADRHAEEEGGGDEQHRGEANEGERGGGGEGKGEPHARCSCIGRTCPTAAAPEGDG